MTLKEAIEMLEKWAKHPPGVVFSSELPAVQLLIEAGKRLQGARDEITVSPWNPLPGETEE